MTTAREFAALLAAYEAVVRARPADPASMARQIRFWISDDPRNHGERMLAAIAERLEAWVDESTLT
jgi:hypothetical protein